MDLIQQLKRDEAFVPYAYPDSEGWWTIGYGTMIDRRLGGGIPEDIAALLLQRKADQTNAWLSSVLPWTNQLDPIRLAVLQNMAYNMEHRLLDFKDTLLAVQQGRYADAAQAMLASIWAKQVGARAVRLAQQMKTGIWV